jgi:aerobic carbon-monoxide dehydrogenase medium subunit
VIPSSFTYKRAGSVDEAVDLAAEYGEDAKYLAGGHSLLPLMKLRLAAPEVLIDLGGLHDLSFVTDLGSHVAIGALTRHHDVHHSELLARELPLLAHAAGEVGDPQIRHRGTIGGSVAHADPASDLPGVLLALDATVIARGTDGSREIPIGDFFQSLFETVLEPEELITEIRVPKPGAGSRGWSFQKFTQRAIDWAIVGVAVQGQAGPGQRGAELLAAQEGREPARAGQQLDGLADDGPLQRLPRRGGRPARGRLAVRIIRVRIIRVCGVPPG